MRRLKDCWSNLFGKEVLKGQRQRIFAGFGMKRFFHSIISNNSRLNLQFSSQHWRITWLVYKSLMFRPANMALIGGQVALFSMIPKPQFMQKASDEKLETEKSQSIFQNELHGESTSSKFKKSSIDEKINEMIIQKTVDDVLEMVDVDEKLDELVLANEFAKESQKVHIRDEEVKFKNNAEPSMIDYTGFENAIDSSKGDILFNKYKFEITETLLNMSPLESVDELEVFSKYLEKLTYSDRVILNKETQLGQKLAFELKDFFFMYNLAQNLNLTDFNSVEMEKWFFWNNNKQLSKFKNLQFEKITSSSKEELAHMIKEKKFSKSNSKKNKTQIKEAEDGSLSFAKGKENAFIYNESAKAGWFFRTWRHYQSKNMLTWEQFSERSKDIDSLLKEDKSLSDYNVIFDYLNKFRNTGIQETSQIIKIYELIPQNDLWLKEAFTRWIVVNEKNLEHILKKNETGSHNVLINNEPLVINMIDSIRKGYSYKPNERWESLLRFFKCINVRNTTDVPQKLLKQRTDIRGFTNVRPITNTNTEYKQKPLIKKNKSIEVTLPIFVKLLEKTIELEKQTQSLRLINCMKCGISTTRKTSDKKNVKEDDILIDLTSYFYKVNEISSDETWLRYDDSLSSIADSHINLNTTNGDLEIHRQQLVKVVCGNSKFKKCIDNLRNNANL
ncbi:hypothetical protein QEN19_000949 [Hanseniaspora menglaensis]